MYYVMYDHLPVAVFPRECEANSYYQKCLDQGGNFSVAKVITHSVDNPAPDRAVHRRRMQSLRGAQQFSLHPTFPLVADRR